MASYLFNKNEQQPSTDSKNAPSVPDSQSKDNKTNIPDITLPSGGGSLKGINEKFEVNALNGSNSYSIPLPISPSRSQFQPDLALTYSSSSGASSFGLGWEMTVHSISRKTDKGIPQYQDDMDSDTYILAGEEDLVPTLEFVAAQWQEVIEERIEDTLTYEVKQYRPRTENQLQYIERWTNKANGAIHWRTISSGNVTSVYGLTDNGKIYDPDQPTNIFEWLIQVSFDDKGNCVYYRYKEEDLTGVNVQLPQEKNRINGKARFTNRHLKTVSYGIKLPYQWSPDLSSLSSNQFYFHLVLDYGDHDGAQPTFESQQPWSASATPFSRFRSGFEIRNYRLCRRILMFHNFAELGATPCLVSALDLDLKVRQGITFLSSVTKKGYIRLNDGSYSEKSFPPNRFHYQEHAWNYQVSPLKNRELSHPTTKQEPAYSQWVDLQGEGIPGLLREQGSGLFYQSNAGNGQLNPAVALNPTPSLTGLAVSALQIQDLEAEGQKSLVSYQTPHAGFFKLEEGEHWADFKAFKKLTSVSLNDPDLRWLDLTGDGKPDLLLSDEQAFTWFPFLGEEGFDQAQHQPLNLDEETNPRLVFSESSQSIFLADMVGDGLTDIVRIRNGEVAYWPNLGYGRFGAKVTMDASPLFDHADHFNPEQIRLADLDGSGTTDIVYLGLEQFRYWLNLSGNGWSESHATANPFPAFSNYSELAVLDLLGTGTSCIVWSSPLSHYEQNTQAEQNILYMDLMSSKKPHLMMSAENGMGREVRFHYRSSTEYYLEAKNSDEPWITKLPFPVHLVSKVEVIDHISGSRFANEYSYAHGYYDYAEREFRGFGRVDQTDTETYEHFVSSGATNVVEQDLHQPPILTRTWYHTGAFLNKERILNQFSQEYFQNSFFNEPAIKEPSLPDDLTTAEWREALRACKGCVLRSETYALDDHPQSNVPINVINHGYEIAQRQAKGSNRYGVFQPIKNEAITFHYERNAGDPRIAHSLVLEVDDLGQPLKSAAVHYPRQSPDASLPIEVQTAQNQLHVVIDETDYTTDVKSLSASQTIYRRRMPCASRRFHLTGASVGGNTLFTHKQLMSAYAGATKIDFETAPSGGVQKRLIGASQILYLKDDLSGPLSFGFLGFLGLPYQSFQLAFTPGLLAQIYGSKVNEALLLQAGFRHVDGDTFWWVPSGREIYSASATNHFYLPTTFTDSLGNLSEIQYDNYDLLVTSTTDAVGNTRTASLDYRVLNPVMTTDANLNRSAVQYDELGIVINSAVMGKNGAGEGDTLLDPTRRFEYDLFNFENNGEPNYTRQYAREEHGGTTWQQSVDYYDGAGKVVMSKVQAEPGMAKTRDASGNIIEVDSTPNVRWVGNGRTVINNKGNPVKAYEPYFSLTDEYETESELVEIGSSPIHYYDALGRVERIHNPIGTFSKTVYNPWQQSQYDSNDTVLESQWYVDRSRPNPAGPEPANEQQRAAWLAAQHADTPARFFTDALGRSILIIEDNASAGQYQTLIEMDISGHTLNNIDARGNGVVSNQYSINGINCYQNNMDSGERWIFNNVLGNPIRQWDSRDQRFRTEYDDNNRAIAVWLKQGVADEILYLQTLYGEGVSGDVTHNLRGKPYQVLDQSGSVRNLHFDFKGNLIESENRLAQEYQQLIDWNVADPNSLLETETFLSSSEFDARNRIKKSITPHSVSQPANEILPVYNASNLLDQVRVKLRGSSTEQTYISNIDYDAKGQRKSIEYGNGTRTNYEYDEKNYRLNRVLTTRSNGAVILQDLHYTYDPVGNITEIRDQAQQTIFFNNAVVEPHKRYRYDALYRLSQAEGREHAGGDQPISHDNSLRINHVSPGDGSALRNYRQIYQYDEVGNILSLNHHGGNGAFTLSWNRAYQYAHNSNRLLQTIDGSITNSYGYDNHGNMSLPHLSLTAWNPYDQLHHIQKGTLEAWYRYNAQGERVRKVVVKGANIEERLYLGGFEIYRERGGGSIQLERETLHIMDDAKRIALIDTKTIDNNIPGFTSETQIRYQYSDHLETATIELDENGLLISYEEYYPHGSTAYQVGRTLIEVKQKRYRYIGKERDEESGLQLHSARYYIAWLGRWLTPDPIGIKGGINVYAYSHNNPIRLSDKNGLDPNDDEINVGSVWLRNIRLRTTVVPSNAQLQLHDPMKPSRYLTGRLRLGVGAEVTGNLQLESTPSIDPSKPSLPSKDKPQESKKSESSGTPVRVQAAAVVDVDTEAGEAKASGQAFATVGQVGQGLWFSLYTRGSLVGPIPGQLRLGDLGSIAQTALLGAHGQARFTGAVQVPNLTLGEVSGRVELENQTIRLRATLRAMTLARVDLAATGQLSSTGVNFQGSGQLTLLGIPSLRFQLWGTADYSGGYDIAGVASGYVPPLTYGWLSFHAMPDEFTAEGHLLGLAYVPKLSLMKDPDPIPRHIRAVSGLPKSDPSVPTGVALGYTFLQYGRGRTTLLGVGLIPSFSSVLVGFTASVPISMPWDR